MLNTSPQKWLLLFGALFGFLSVAAGSFGAHALKQRVGQEMLSVFEVGVRYQMYHALAIFAAVWLSTVVPSSLAPLAGWFFFAGTFIFSGSLYFLALTGIRTSGAITPIGGLVMLIGWLCLAIAIVK